MFAVKGLKFFTLLYRNKKYSHKYQVISYFSHKLQSFQTLGSWQQQFNCKSFLVINIHISLYVIIIQVLNQIQHIHLSTDFKTSCRTARSKDVQVPHIKWHSSYIQPTHGPILSKSSLGCLEYFIQCRCYVKVVILYYLGINIQKRKFIHARCRWTFFWIFSINGWLNPNAESIDTEVSYTSRENVFDNNPGMLFPA